MKSWREVIMVALAACLVFLLFERKQKNATITLLESNIEKAEANKAELKRSIIEYKELSDKYLKLSQQTTEKVKIQKIYVKDTVYYHSLSVSERDSLIRAIFLPH